MRFLRSAAFLAALALTGFAPVISTAQPSTPLPPCGTGVKVSFVCDVSRPEDLVQAPGTDWIVVANLADARRPGSGGLTLINDKTRVASRVTWRPGKARGAYKACAAAPDPMKYSGHGLSIRPAGRGRSTLFVVSHGGREAIEVFDIDARRGVPTVTWAGCIPAPPGSQLNSVTALADGRVFATDFVRPPLAIIDALAGRNTGAVYMWKPGGAFEKLAGTDLPGPNGIEVTPDKRHLFVAVTGTSTVLRYELAAMDKAPTAIKTDFRTDNLRWAPDGRLLLAGPGTAPNCSQRCSTVVVGALDPKTMALTELIRTPAEPDFQGLSSALVVGKTLWLGSYLADRAAYAPLAK